MSPVAAPPPPRAPQTPRGAAGGRTRSAAGRLVRPLQRRVRLAERRMARHERAPVTSHLEELRWRLVCSIGTLVTAMAVAAVYRHQLFELLNRPLDARFEPTTFGVTEPFFTTLTVCAYAGLIVSSPVLTYHLYQYVAPALSDWQRRAARPYLVATPLMFLSGVAFGYMFVLGPAVRFLLGIGTDSFDVQIRAQEYYGFVSTTLVFLGIAFLYPLGLLALARLGIVNAGMLRRNRRFALLGIALLAALLPTADPVSLAIEMLPLLALYELSILLVRAQERRALHSSGAGDAGNGTDAA